ncbi:hypothetical protein OKE68_08430 [Riemerella anatipestifer]|uniref:Uncharacterized protein n=1 Tax=Riemerella anatipestifer TaxID=34085 RepID=A0A1A5FNZ3_RIEAN|nr:hypothetical protein [Riemerella anatipestifer]AQY20993.1 hypothetical protein AB406_0027 [Riemerella anatipestifer]AZZ57769.1 hypothetical protein AWB57_01180 [Riemerella anatipestifer]MBT0552600.1 hypothetical protein [Riemerella anatipestifer]MBT0552839.1 hypothetical protein [Riemerella anatipestifer]MBT0573858.1 hypothetical protein [Riemerella anatipestifer]
MSKLKSITIASSIAEFAKAEAEKIFKNYPELEEVYITSDLQGFKELEKAENQATYLTDKKVHYFQRKDLSQPSEIVKIDVEPTDIPKILDEENSDDNAPQDTDLDNTKDTATKTEEQERAELMAKYEAKHGKKAPHNIGLEKLRASVED